MNREVLDRLLIDRALGGLAPDVGELLTAYLDHDPAAAARAQEFSLATTLASQALKAPHQPALPPFPADLLSRAERSRHHMRIVIRASSMAASLLLGIALGAWALHSHVAADGLSAVDRPVAAGGSPAVPSARIGETHYDPTRFASAAPQRPTSAHPAAQPNRGFWSAQRLYEQANQYSPPRKPQLNWISPIREPLIGGAS